MTVAVGQLFQNNNQQTWFFTRPVFWKGCSKSRNIFWKTFVVESHFDETIWYNATEAGLRNRHFPWVFSIFSKHSPSRLHINVWYFDASLVFNNKNLFEAYAKKNSYSGNSQKKTLGKTLDCRESPFLVKLQVV